MKSKLKCPICGGSTVKYADKIVCSNCSVIVEASVKPKQLVKTKKGNSSELSITPENSKHNPINFELNSDSQKRWQKILGVSNATEKRLSMTLFEITRIGKALAVPESTLKRSLTIYKRIINSNLTRRKTIPVLACTILYFSCRQDRIPITLNQLGRPARIAPDRIRRMYNTLSKQMKLASEPTSPEVYVDNLARKLFQKQETIALAHRLICILLGESFTKGKNPLSIACSACYISSILIGERITRRQVSQEGCITEATLTGRYREISKKFVFKISL